MKATLHCRSCRSILLLICLVKSESHETRKDAKKWTKSENESKRVCLCYTTTRNVYLSEVPISQAQTRKFR